MLLDFVCLCVAGSCHTQNPIKKVFADKGYFGENNREFLSLNNIQDGITSLGSYPTAVLFKKAKDISRYR